MAGPPGCLDAPGPDRFRDRVVHAPVTEAGVAAARNAGVRAAAGSILAFLDDDAVPEPAWLGELLAGFLAPEVGAVGGFVLGRSGVRWQWQAAGADAAGEDVALPLPPGSAPAVPARPPGVAIKTPGTNMAFRRAALAAIGGFDPAFRFFLDETDADRRLEAAGWRIALAPRAVVHHAFAASAQRSAARVPRDLLEIGASKAAFLARHLAPPGHAAALTAFRAGERRRLLRHMVAGRLEPGEVRRLMARLEAGLAAGAMRPPHVPADLAPRTAPGPGPFVRQGPGRGLRLAITPSRRDRRLALDAAARAAAAGAEVTVIEVAPRWPQPHRVAFESPGLWRHSGLHGVWRPGAPALDAAAAELRRTQPWRDWTHWLRPAARNMPGPLAGTSVMATPSRVYVVESFACVRCDLDVIFPQGGRRAARSGG